MKKFKKLYIEITNICNLNCSFCLGHSRSPRYMSPEEFEYILSRTYSRAEKFYLHLMGEPTSHPQFGEILDICKKYKIKTNITTNGTLLSQKGSLILEKGVCSVCISLHSFEANNDSISPQKYLSVVMDFCSKALNTNTTVELRLWNMDKKSISSKESLNYKILEYISDRLSPDCDIFSMAENTFLSMEKNRRKNFRIKENIFLGMSERFVWPDTKNSPHKECRGFCYGMRNQIAVLSDGTVVPCCLDGNGAIALGNIFKQDFDDIIKSERAKKLYDGFTNQIAVEPLCQSCGYMKKYFDLKFG